MIYHEFTIGNHYYYKVFVMIIWIFQHYDAVMKYINQGPLMINVHMHKPHSTARHYMDALLAFWPGLQVSYVNKIESMTQILETYCWKFYFQLLDKNNNMWMEYKW